MRHRTEMKMKAHCSRTCQDMDMSSLFRTRKGVVNTYMNSFTIRLKNLQVHLKREDLLESLPKFTETQSQETELRTPNANRH